MDERATFTGFDPYKLTGVTVTDIKLGHGSYATVLELEYMGLKCAGKKIHEVLLEQGDASYQVRRFEEECRLLSQVRHPNIVQFLGVYFQEGVRAPILVMEFLPTNLTSCIKQYGILPKEISYSILHDVALGLCYLHSQTPPIIHRDLSSNNVLLTPNMTAKISDLGVARMLNLTPLQVSCMTQTPGTPAYMPPEVMVANPKYDTSVDEFSYGILMIHMFSGQWPEPQVGPNHTEPDGTMIPVSEAERRGVFLRAIEQDHPLMEIILRCISNDVKKRIHASIFCKHVLALKEQFSTTINNRLELLKSLADQQMEKTLLELEYQSKEVEIESVRTEMKKLKLQAQLSCSQNKLERLQSEAKILYLTETANMSGEFNKKLLQEKEQSQQEFAVERRRLYDELAEKTHSWMLLTKQNSDLMLEVVALKQENQTLSHNARKQNNSIQEKAIIIESNRMELEAKTEALTVKDRVISEMSDQLTKAKECLLSNQRVLLTSFTWERCANWLLPTESSRGPLGGTTTINGRVYFAGMLSFDENTLYIVYCYDPSQDKWTTLPPLPVKYFGLGQVNGKLVAVGGLKKSDEHPFESSEVYTYDEQTKKWKQTIPPMPTARHSPGVLSLQSALVVAGGGFESTRQPRLSEVFKQAAAFAVDLRCTDFYSIVEIFKLDTLQWYKATPLPNPCQIISLLDIDNTCYALGGYRIQERGEHKTINFNQALYISVDDLLGNTEPLNQASKDFSSEWKRLPDSPVFGAFAAMLSGKLLAIGQSRKMLVIYMHVATTNSWAYINTLPSQRGNFAVANLSPTEILVVVGSSVYKGMPVLF